MEPAAGRREDDEPAGSGLRAVGAEDELGTPVAVQVGGHDLGGERLRRAAGVVEPPQPPAGRPDRVHGPVRDGGDDLGTAVAAQVDERRRGDPARRVVVAVGAHGRLARQRQPPEALVPARRPRPAAVGAVERHDRVGLRLVRLVALHVRQPDHLVAPVAVEVDDRRRRGRPLQPRRRADVGPGARVPVVVVALHARAQPADELPPAEPGADVTALPVGEPRRGEHGRPVVVEEVDLVVVERDDELELRVVVELPDPDVLAVGAVALVADAVEGGVAAGPGERVVAGPRRRGRARRPVQRAGGVEDEDLGAGRRRVRRGHDDLDAPVAVQVARGHPARLGALPAAARGRGPARLQPQLARRRGRRPRRSRRCRRRRSPACRRRRGRPRRRARRPARSSRSPCRGGGRGRRTRTSSTTARRSPGGGPRRGRRGPARRTSRSRRSRCCARSAAWRRAWRRPPLRPARRRARAARSTACERIRATYPVARRR